MLTDYRGYTDFVNSVDSTPSISSTKVRLGAEDINGTQFTVDKSYGSSNCTFNIFTQEQAAAKAGIEINGDNVKPITDYIYYDAINDSLWLGAYSSNGFYFINKVNSDTHYSNPCTLSGLSIYPNAQYTAFAASGTELYIAYTNVGTSYLQRAKIEGQNDSFTITTIGNPQSTQDMGVDDGQITDIVIHYDGYVYVLVSQTGSKNFTDMYMVNNLISGSEETTVYSRGAIVRLEPTSSGFKLSAKTGWTEDSRIIASSNKDKNPFTSGSDSDNYTFYDVNAYIPEYSERNSHFYGPRRFVAIKPKELAIADCGANIVMPDYGSKKRGKLFKHNRIVKVDLYKFALESSSVIDLNSINFSNLSLSGSIESVTDFKGLNDNDEK